MLEFLGLIVAIFSTVVVVIFIVFSISSPKNILDGY
jgi:hypothetical protein